MILIFVINACAPKRYGTQVYQKVCHARFILTVKKTSTGNPVINYWYLYKNILPEPVNYYKK